MLHLGGGSDFSCPRDMKKLWMSLNQACQTHVPKSCVMWLFTCWYNIYRDDSLFFIAYYAQEILQEWIQGVFYILDCLYVEKCTSEERWDNGTWHTLRPKVPSWISNLARNPFWVSQASIELSLSRTVLGAEINLSTVVAYSILYQWAVIFSIFRRWIVRSVTMTKSRVSSYLRAPDPYVFYVGRKVSGYTDRWTLWMQRAVFFC
jgi:hypothetical protein